MPSSIILDSSGKNLGGVGDSAKVQTWANTPLWSYALQAWAPWSQPTDVIVIRGSATKTLKIQSIIISAESTASSGVASVSLVRRTTAPTLGSATATTLTGTPHDINDGASTASVIAYNGTATGFVPGTAYTGGGLLGCQQLICGNSGTIPAQPVEWLLEQMGVKPIFLRGVNDYVCINLGGTTYGGIATLKLDVEIDIEEDNS